MCSSAILVLGAKPRTPQLLLLLLLLLQTCLPGCSGSLYGVPKGTWNQMSLDQRDEVIRGHFSNKTILAFQFLRTPATESYGEIAIHPDGKKQHLDITALRLSNSRETREAEKNGYYFWAVAPGTYRIKVYPSAPKGDWVEFGTNVLKYAATYKEPWEFRLEARPGVVLDLGLFLFESHQSGVREKRLGIELIQYTFHCTKAPSGLVVQAFQNTYPEIYGALEGSIVAD